MDKMIMRSLHLWASHGLVSMQSCTLISTVLALWGIERTRVYLPWKLMQPVVLTKFMGMNRNFEFYLCTVNYVTGNSVCNLF